MIKKGLVAAGHPGRDRDHRRKLMIKKGLVAALILSLSFVSSAHATTLKINLTVDNEYWVYINTNDSEEGTLIGWNNDWRNAETYYYTLTPRKTYYVHVKGVDWGGHMRVSWAS